jgi:hypothetical protein
MWKGPFVSRQKTKTANRQGSPALIARRKENKYSQKSHEVRDPGAALELLDAPGGAYVQATLGEAADVFENGVR